MRGPIHDSGSWHVRKGTARSRLLETGNRLGEERKSGPRSSAPPTCGGYPVSTRRGSFHDLGTSSNESPGRRRTRSRGSWPSSVNHQVENVGFKRRLKRGAHCLIRRWGSCPAHTEDGSSWFAGCHNSLLRGHAPIGPLSWEISNSTQKELDRNVYSLYMLAPRGESRGTPSSSVSSKGLTKPFAENGGIHV